MFSQEGEHYIEGKHTDHTGHSEFVTEGSNKNDDDNISQNEEKHDGPGNEIGGVHDEVW